MRPARLCREMTTPTWSGRAPLHAAVISCCVLPVAKVAGGGPHDQIHRRLCDVFPISRGCPPRPGRLVQTAGKGRPDPGTDQDQARRIWPGRATTCRQTRQEAPRDDLLSGVHALLHAEPEGQLQDWNAHREISLAAQSHVVAGPAATNTALVGPGTGQHSQRRAEGPLRLLRHCRKLSFPAKGPSGGRTLLAQNAVQPELGWAHHVGHVPPDQTATTDLATKAVPSLSGVTSSRSAVKHLLKSVVREICTLRSVGTGGGRPPPVTRWVASRDVPLSRLTERARSYPLPWRHCTTRVSCGVTGPLFFA